MANLDSSELLDFSAWHEDGQDHLLPFLSALNPTPDTLFALVQFLWPRFVTYHEGVFLAFRFDETNIQLWEQQLDEDMPAIERMVNHIHLASDVFIHPFENVSYPIIEFIGQQITAMWRAKLKIEFPGREFSVVGEKDTLEDDYVITFWQPRD